MHWIGKSVKLSVLLILAVRLNNASSTEMKKKLTLALLRFSLAFSNFNLSEEVSVG